MNLFEAQETFQKMYPDKLVQFEFDDKCHRIHELIYTDGVPNPVHHIESHQVKVTVEGLEPIYVPIAPHRQNATWDYMKKMINSKKEPVE